jgi:hypothetical protein
LPVLRQGDNGERTEGGGGGDRGGERSAARAGGRRPGEFVVNSWFFAKQVLARKKRIAQWELSA